MMIAKNRVTKGTSEIIEGYQSLYLSSRDHSGSSWNQIDPIGETPLYVFRNSRRNVPFTEAIQQLSNEIAR